MLPTLSVSKSVSAYSPSSSSQLRMTFVVVAVAAVRDTASTNRKVAALLRGFSAFIGSSFLVRLVLISRIAGPDETKNRVGRKSSAWVQIRFRGVEFRKNPYNMSSPNFLQVRAYCSTQFFGPVIRSDWFPWRTSGSAQ